MYEDTYNDENREAWYALFLAITQNLSAEESILAIRRGEFGRINRTILAVAAKKNSLREVARMHHCSVSTVSRAARADGQRYVQLKIFR